MRRGLVWILTIGMAAGLLAGCGQSGNQSNGKENVVKLPEDVIDIQLSVEGITVAGNAISTEEDAAVYAANDIIFYLADQGFTYGEGEKEDEHTQEEADAHTVVHITEPGSYAVSGYLSAGQIAIDLGEDAEEDPEAVVTLYLNGVDITCDVAPAVIFYNVYECGEKDEETATKDVDTSAAGANVVIVDNTVNTVNGSYVARIYKSYTLNEAGTEVVDNKKLHKYDGAFYSKMSLNMDGGDLNSGVLNINAENEGLDSELHLTINGGIINSNSGNEQPYAVFMSRKIMAGGINYTVKDAEGKEVASYNPENDFMYMIVSASDMMEDGSYTLWNGDEKVAEGMTGMNGMGGPGMGGFGGGMPGGFGGFGGDFEGDFGGGRMPEGFEFPEGGFEFPGGEFEFSEGMEPGEMPAMPEGGFDFPEGGFEIPEGGFPEGMERPDFKNQGRIFKIYEAAVHVEQLLF